MAYHAGIESCQDFTELKGHMAEKDRVFIKRSWSDAESYLTKKYGNEVLISEDVDIKIPRVKTGLYHFDKSIGGGIPLGRIIELYGPEESGKTTLAAMIAQRFQLKKNKSKVLYLDYENTLDLEYMKLLGLSLTKDKWLLSQPPTLEEGVDVLGVLAYTGDLGIAIVDSVAAMTPADELENSMSNNSMGLQARGMGKTFRKLIGVLKKTDTPVIFINQIREKIGVMFGSPEVTPGGKALKFYASIRMRISSKKSDWFPDDGKLTTINIVKNKTSLQQHQKSQYQIRPGLGFMSNFELFEMLLEKKMLREQGRKYAMGKKVMSSDEWLQFLSDSNTREKLIELYEKKNV